MRYISDTENQSPSPVLTPVGSPCLAVFPEEKVPDSTSLSEDSQVTLARPVPVTRLPGLYKICINMKVKCYSTWRDIQPIIVDLNNTADFECRVNRYIRDGL
jgi:hypothetical protein